MSDSFPIPIPPHLPIRISPCPIVESNFEVRFTSSVSWSSMPGLLLAQIRDRYPEQKDLPLSQLPEEVRKHDPALHNLPLVQFLGPKFIVQIGPRTIGLGTTPNHYPGWTEIRNELEWLLEKTKAAGFIKETERIGVRYIDFFPGDVLPKLLLSVHVADKPLSDVECAVTTSFRRGRLAIRLQVFNGAIVKFGADSKQGTVLDVDAWYGPLDADLFVNGKQRFDEAHRTIKELFFGLLRPEFLATMNPEYT